MKSDQVLLTKDNSGIVKLKEILLVNREMKYDENIFF
jgi:hypothetical protein